MTTPHFHAPFSLKGGAAAVDDQDTLSEVESCVYNVVSCTIGDFPDERTFGVPDRLFSNAPLDIAGIANAIAAWEPRAKVTITDSYADPNDASSHTVGVRVSL